MAHPGDKRRPPPPNHTHTKIHPYTLTNAQGATQIVKFKMSPKGGEVGLNDEDAKGKPADFLVDELKARLARKKPAGSTFWRSSVRPAMSPSLRRRPGLTRRRGAASSWRNSQ